MIDRKNAKQIVNEPSSFFVSTISKTSKFKPKKSSDEDKHLFLDSDFYDTDKGLRYYDPTCM